MSSGDAPSIRDARPMWAGLTAVALVAFAVRLLWALAMRVDPRRLFLLDMSAYDLGARRLAAGRGYLGFHDLPMVFFPPGYPMILAGWYKVFGTSLVVAWVANATFGALTCLLVYAIGTRLFDRRIGFGAAALLAVFPGDVFMAALTFSETTFCFLFTAVLYLFVRWNAAAPPSRWLAFGVLLGVTSLVRGVALPFLVVPFAVWTLSAGLRIALARGMVATVGLALVILPWTARNYVVIGSPIVLSTDGAYAFFNAHNPVAFGTQSGAENTLRKEEWPWFGELSPVERERIRTQLEVPYALRYMLTHPWHELTLIPRRIYYLYGQDHHALMPSGTGPRRVAIGGQFVDLDALLGTVADVYFFAVVILALVGLPRALRPGRPETWLLPLTIAYFTLLHGVLFFGDPRFHAPLVGTFCVLAALGLRTLFARRA